jgi:hypothetical protein
LPLEGANLDISKWAFVIKRNIDYLIARVKVTLVARGFLYKYGVPYINTFIPIVRHNTLQAFFALVCLEDLECH